MVEDFDVNIDNGVQPYFLDRSEIAFFRSLCSSIVPDGENPDTEPGALSVGAISYIDSSLSEFPKETQLYYREAIRAVNHEAIVLFSKNFVSLDDSHRNLVIRRMFLNPKTREMIFDLRSLVIEGFYSDYRAPWYHGMAAWDYIQFGGKGISALQKDWGSLVKVWREWNSRKRTPKMDPGSAEYAL